MNNALDFVFNTISNCVSWLNSWKFLDVSFLVWLISFAIISIVIDYFFG